VRARLSRVVAIRDARPDDIEPVLVLWELAAGPTRLPGTPESVGRLLERDPAALTVAEADGRVVGTLVVGWDGWRCHLYRLAVHPDHRRRQIAARLVAEARARARDLGARRLDAMVDNENDLGMRFWSAMGFTSGVSDDHRWTALLRCW
jgi:ribosomal protein S18 acetylase RimI-like enzyme